MISFVVAMSDNRVIGRDGAIPWRIPEDMRRFKVLTIGKPCIMGRKTWESLPIKPLPGRENIVVTRDENFRAEGARLFHTVDEALAFAQRGHPAEITVIGGAKIFAAMQARADRIHLTEVHAAIEGDTFLPKFDPALWRETTREDHATAGGLRYSYVTLERAKPTR